MTRHPLMGEDIIHIKNTNSMKSTEAWRCYNQKENITKCTTLSNCNKFFDIGLWKLKVLRKTCSNSPQKLENWSETYEN